MIFVLQSRNTCLTSRTSRTTPKPYSGNFSYSTPSPLFSPLSWLNSSRHCIRGYTIIAKNSSNLSPFSLLVALTHIHHKGIAFFTSPDVGLSLSTPLLLLLVVSSLLQSFSNNGRQIPPVPTRAFPLHRVVTPWPGYDSTLSIYYSRLRTCSKKEDNLRPI